MKSVETRGLVLYTKNYREKDKLVKIFTESFGKRMFFVKNFARSKYASSLQNFTAASLMGTINDEGFSFLDDVSDAVTYKHISEDIFLNAHASYIISLADAAIPDNQYDSFSLRFHDLSVWTCWMRVSIKKLLPIFLNYRS